MKTIFSSDNVTSKEKVIVPRMPLNDYQCVIGDEISAQAKEKGVRFSKEIAEGFIGDFENPETDRMAHVSTFLYRDGVIYMSYYVNKQIAEEDANYQTARLAYCSVDDTEHKTFLDIQTVGEACYDGTVEMVYDTILMPKDDRTIYVLWTAKVSGNYYRLYRTFDTVEKTLGDVQVNRFKVGEIVNDFSTTGIQNALAENGYSFKTMYSDIGIMQKLSTREENGVTYYYTGTYSGEFTAIIKSPDLITWEYVAEPDFENESQWENATYVLGDKVFYFVRQYGEIQYGFLTVYDLKNGTWEKPVLITDTQSRSDFIMYNGQLYLFHAPHDREHIGIVRIDTDNIAESEVVLQSDIGSSCFYPFIQYGDDGELRMSYTVSRQHIRLAKFTLSKYL